MTKDEFLQFLSDPDICKEIFEIVKKGGKPVTSAPPVQVALQIQPQTSVQPTQFTQPAQPAFSSIADKLKSVYLNDNAPQAQPTAPSKPSLVVDPAKIPPPPPVEEPKKLSSIADKLKFLREHLNKVEEEKIATKSDAQSVGTTPHAENFIVVTKKHCPICEENFRAVKPKTRLIVEKRDLDYCVHYKDFDPYLYTVFVCEHCGFAAEEKKFLTPMPNKTKESLRQFLKENDMKVPFIQERTAEDALSFFELAILFSELTDHSKGRQAILNLNAAWLCRCEGLTEREQDFMKQAAEDFQQAFDGERWPINGISLEMATYLCAAIYFMTGDMEQATNWLSKIMNNASLRTTSPKLFEQARDMWQDIKRANRA